MTPTSYVEKFCEAARDAGNGHAENIRPELLAKEHLTFISLCFLSDIPADYAGRRIGEYCLPENRNGSPPRVVDCMPRA